MRLNSELLTFWNDVASHDKDEQQDETSKCVCNDLTSSNCCDETEQREGHLMHPNER